MLYGQVASAAAHAFEQLAAELRRADLREQAVETYAETVEVGSESAVAPHLQFALRDAVVGVLDDEVHAQRIHWHGTDHQLSVGRVDIAPHGRDLPLLSGHTLTHCLPVLATEEHLIGSHTDDGNTCQRHQYDHKEIARYDTFAVEIHCAEMSVAVVRRISVVCR